MPNFEEILNKKSSDVKPPVAYPLGTYHCLVDGPPEPGKSSQKQTDFLRYKLKILAAMGDVDAAAAAEQQIVGKIINHEIYVTENSDWRLKEFLIEHLGIDPQEGTPEEKSLKQMVGESPGHQVLCKLKHEISQDGKRIFHRVESTAHV